MNALAHRQRSVAWDLTLALILTVALVSIVTVSLAYLNASRRAKAQLEAKADEYVKCLAEFEELPLWNMDAVGIQKVGLVYAQNPLVNALTITDEAGQVRFQLTKPADPTLIHRSAKVLHGGQVIGHIQLAITFRPYIESNRQLFWAAVGIALIIILVLGVATGFFLHRFLQAPLRRLGELTNAFAAGRYDAPEIAMPFVEFKPLVGLLGDLGQKITRQMAQLRESRDALEQRVQERTQELAHSNDSLRLEMQQRIQVEADLRKAHNETERLLASLSSFLIGMSGNFTIRRWNSAAETTFGKEAAQVIGKNLAEVAIGWDWQALTKLIPGWPQVEHGIQLPEVPYQRPNLKPGWLSLTISPLKSLDGQLEGFLLLGMDITERRELQLQLAQALKLESVGRLAAGIAHEINTPIQYVGDNLNFLAGAFADLTKLIAEYEQVTAAIKANTLAPARLTQVETVRQQTDFDYLKSEIPTAIQQAIEGVKRVAHIVSAMKEFSHPGSKEKIPTDLNRAIQTTLTVARSEWKYVAEVETELAADLPLVICLPDEFNQVILNLVVNAAQAIGEGIKAKPTGKGTIRITTKLVDSWAEIRIADTGAGIPEAIRPKIFEPFFTTKEVGKGTGQGLAIARSTIVNKHGGQLTFESCLGRGTTFIIRLPLKPTSAAKP